MTDAKAKLCNFQMTADGGSGAIFCNEAKGHNGNHKHTFPAQFYPGPTIGEIGNVEIQRADSAEAQGAPSEEKFTEKEWHEKTIADPANMVFGVPLPEVYKFWMEHKERAQGASTVSQPSGQWRLPNCKCEKPGAAFADGYCIDCWPGYDLCAACGDYRCEHINPTETERADPEFTSCHCDNKDCRLGFVEGSQDRVMNTQEFKEFKRQIKITEAAPVSQWISADTLPEKLGYYLVWSRSCRRPWVALFNPHKSEHKWNYVDAGDPGDEDTLLPGETNEITHWQPLPAPPKENL